MVTHSTCESSVSLTPSATGPRTYAFMLVDVLDQSVHEACQKRLDGK
jgi:hypothetical protein